MPSNATLPSFTRPEAKILLQFNKTRHDLTGRDDISPRDKLSIDRIIRVACDEISALQRKHQDSNRLLLRFAENMTQYSRLRESIDCVLSSFLSSLSGEQQVAPESLAEFFGAMSQQQLVEFYMANQRFGELMNQAMPLSTKIVESLSMFTADSDDNVIYVRYHDLRTVICHTINDINAVLEGEDLCEMEVPQNSADASGSDSDSQTESDSQSSSRSGSNASAYTTIDCVFDLEPDDEFDDFGMYQAYHDLKLEINEITEKYQSEFNSLVEVSKAICKALGVKPADVSSDDSDSDDSTATNDSQDASRRASIDNQVTTGFFAARQSGRDEANTSGNESNQGASFGPN